MFLMFENIYLLSLCPITDNRFKKRARTVSIALKKCNYISFNIKKHFSIRKYLSLLFQYLTKILFEPLLNRRPRKTYIYVFPTLYSLRSF